MPSIGIHTIRILGQILCVLDVLLAHFRRSWTRYPNMEFFEAAGTLESCNFNFNICGG